MGDNEVSDFQTVDVPHHFCLTAVVEPVRRLVKEEDALYLTTQRN